jgi:hypothetical protein
MALTAKQRAALPDTAFAYPSKRKYPVPTKAQAKRAGISEAQRLRLHRNALARSTNTRTAGSYSTIARKVRARAGGKVASVKRGAKGGATRPASKATARRR